VPPHPPTFESKKYVLAGAAVGTAVGAAVDDIEKSVSTPKGKTGRTFSEQLAGKTEVGASHLGKLIGNDHVRDGRDAPEGVWGICVGDGATDSDSVGTLHSVWRNLELLTSIQRFLLAECPRAKTLYAGILAATRQKLAHRLSPY
jgi:hypothetical protein